MNYISPDLTPEVLDDFFRITRKDVRAFLIRFSIFYQSDYRNISDFYQGKTKNITAAPFKNFINIKKEVKDILSIYLQFNRQLENIKYVDLLESIEQINDILLTLNNINKWARTTTDSFGYSPSFKLQYVFSQFDNLEKIAKNVLLSKNPQDDWFLIAIDNNLSENDYSSEGGNVLNLTLNSDNIQNFNIKSVVDVINGKSIYGKDLDRYLHFDVANQDISVLSEEETIKQAVLILINLRKNDNKDFLEHGLQGSLVVGQNRNLLNFPLINRQLSDSFRNDDTLKNFALTQMYFQEDILFIDFQVSTRLDEIQKLTIQL